jgi:lambda family phage portal protein
LAQAQPSLLQRAATAWSVFSRGVAASAGFAGTAFQGAARDGGVLKYWRAALSSADREYLSERRDLVSRQRDLARNDTAVASAKRRRVSSAVGNGWQLVAEVDGAALGLDAEDTEALNAQIESAWRGYAFGHTFEMDAQRQLTFGGLLRTVASQWFVDGEAFAHIAWSPGEPCATWATRLDLIDTDRVSNANGASDGDLLRAGVELDPLSRAPIAYWVRERHPSDVGASSAMAQWRRIERWTPWGRPNFVHVYDRERPGQTRGVSQLAAALHALKSLDKFSKATVENAILNALLLGAVKSNGGPQAVSESLSTQDAQEFEKAREEIYDGRTVNLTDGVSLPVLPHGDELQLFTQSRDVNSFEGFTRTILRRVAAALGVTYEELAMDYSTTNYSSARAAMIHAYAETLALQTLIRDQLVQPFYVAWLEEAVETGRIDLPAGAPDYWANLPAYTRCRWIAPGKGYIDATKEIQAEAMEIENSFDTLADICARNGKNWRDVLRQRKRELEHFAKLGLSPPATGVTLAAAAAPQIVAGPDANPAPAQAA